MSEWCWAVDPHVSHLAFAFAELGGQERVHVERLIVDSGTRGGQRLGWLDRQVRIFANMTAANYPPACVWVEQPSGRWRNLTLIYAVGVVQAAMFETLACPVWTIPPSTWKQRTVGRGNATKEQVQAWVAARAPGLGSPDEHLCDAFAMACAGRAMLDSREWGAAA